MKGFKTLQKSVLGFLLFLTTAFGIVAIPAKIPFTKKRILCQAAEIEFNSRFEDYSPQKFAQGNADGCEKKIQSEAQSASAKDIFDIVTPELIEFFEQNFAKSNIITGLKPQRVQKLMKAYGVSENKLYTLIALQFICKQNGKKMTLTSLSKMSVGEIVALSRDEFTNYYNNLSEEERAQINQNFERHKEKHGMPKE